jgi:hypothetical protein
LVGLSLDSFQSSVLGPSKTPKKKLSMSYVYRCTLLAVITLSVSALACAQAAASSAASSTVGPSSAPGKPAKPPAPKTPKAKYFVELYPLPSKSIPPKLGSCFPGTLEFPATNASDVAKLLTSESGFTLAAVSPDKVVVYYQSQKPKSADRQTLENQMDRLAAADFNDVIAIPVPTGSAEKNVAQLTLPPDGSIVVKAVGSNCVVVATKNQADPLTVAAVGKSISSFYWRNPVAPPTQRLFYLDATTVAKKLASPSDSTDETSSGGKTAPSKPKASSSGGEGVTATSTATPTISISVVPGSSTATADGNGGKSSDSNQQPGQTNPDSTNSGNINVGSNGTSNKPSSPDKTTSKNTPAAAPKPPAMQPVNDMMVYSNEDGTDRGIFERNRLMAVLDLPRPEVLLNIWSLQASSADYKIVTAEAEASRELIAHHNDLLQGVIDKGWDSLSQKMAAPGFFDQQFYAYVTKKFAETTHDIEVVSAEAMEQQPSTAKKNSTGPIDSGNQSRLEQTVDSNRPRWGWCDSFKYCLGFNRAFEPLRPTFTNLLIGMIAAKDPYNSAQETVSAMESHSTASAANAGCRSRSSAGQDPCADQDTVARFRSCIRRVDLQLHTFSAQASQDCELKDRIAMNEQIIGGQDESFHLECFREQTEQSFGPRPPGNNLPYATTRPGLLRAAVADFLFNYKWAIQYPHDFIPYDLSQSAQELNSEFNPLVLAFNRDVSAFTVNLQAELQCKYEADISRHESGNWFKNGDNTFINDGILSVRGISGIESLVDTVTQSFFDATNPPSLTDLAKSISDAEKNVPGVLKTNLSADEAAVLLGALNSVQPAEAKIGRELKLDITPHSLAGASSAELEVKLTAQEVANPTRFTSDKSAEDALSRIAKHDVSTRVRVESLKLFEVSAFSAMLQRPRSKFPIVPPFFEVPYFGSFIGWPLNGAKVYHRSTAIVSAVIVPTAADLAFGIDFGADRLCDEAGCHRANSPNDFGLLPLRNFHKAMVECLASGGSTPYTGLLGEHPGSAAGSCENLALFTPKEKTSKRNVSAPATVPPE